MTFLCDEMVVRLGRWLRAAGYDTVLPRPGTDDREITARALAEDRLILTRDRQLLQRKAAMGRALILVGNDLASWVAEVDRALGVDWLKDPFSRCLLCNTPLKEATFAAGSRGVPARGALPLRTCPRCDKLYWPGGHVARMRLRLASWQRGEYV